MTRPAATSLRIWFLAWLGLISLMAVAEPCRAIDYQPFGFVPSPPGTITLLVYYEFMTHSQYNNTSTGTATNHTGLIDQLGVQRLNYYNEFYGTPFRLDELQFFGTDYAAKINGQSLGHAAGAEDLILAGTLWPVSLPQRATWFSVSDWVHPPTGTYSNTRALNLGDNRWSNNVQIDYTQGFAGKWTVDVSGEWVAYGPNRSVDAANQTLSQTGTYNAYTWVSYDITQEMRQLIPSLGPASVSMGYAGKFGGVEKIAGVRTGNETHEQQLRWTYEAFVAPKWQLLLSLNHDVSVSGGFKDKFGVTLRVATVF
jgi:hypothetical protein